MACIYKFFCGYCETKRKKSTRGSSENVNSDIPVVKIVVEDYDYISHPTWKEDEIVNKHSFADPRPTKDEAEIDEEYSYTDPKPLMETITSVEVTQLDIEKLCLKFEKLSLNTEEALSTEKGGKSAQDTSISKNKMHQKSSGMIKYPDQNQNM